MAIVAVVSLVLLLLSPFVHVAVVVIGKLQRTRRKREGVSLPAAPSSGNETEGKQEYVLSHVTYITENCSWSGISTDTSPDWRWTNAELGDTNSTYRQL